MFQRQAPFVLAIVVVLAAGAFHGNWTNRWDDSPELDASLVYLPKLPMTIGPWVGEDVPQTEAQLRTFTQAELRVAVVRAYKHRESGERIDIMAVCGPPGPIGTHTPEACYGGAGFTLQVAPSPLEFPVTNPTSGKPNSFWVADFRDNKTVTRNGLKIYWSFRPNGPDGHWEASSKPRGEYALNRALYKIYVIRPMLMMGPSPIDDSITPEFIEPLLAAMEESVFAPQHPPAQAPPSVAVLR